MNSPQTVPAAVNESAPHVRLWASWVRSPGIMVLGLAIMLALGPLLLLQDSDAADYDLGFHLRTADWILQHHAVPRVETFTSSALGRPWVAYSWLFELLLAASVRYFDLVGVILLGIAMRLLIAVAAWDLFRRVLPRFWPNVGLTALVVGVAGVLTGPRPVLFSVLFVILVLDAVLAAEQSRTARPLWLLLPIFALWSNLHIQFVHGLCVLGAFALEPWLVARFRPTPQPGVHVLQRWTSLGACTFATLLNPYGIGVWKVLWTFLHQPNFYEIVREMKAPDFRVPVHYVVLAVTIGAGFALGRQKHIRPALAILFIFASEQGFRSVREMWFTTLISAVVIATAWAETAVSSQTPATVSLGFREKLAVGLCTVALIGAGARYFNLNNGMLWMAMYGRFPEVAARYAEDHHFRGRIFNDYDWGGYLMWRLPEMLVSIDGRANNVHDQEFAMRSRDTWNAKPGWAQNPELNAADLIVANTEKPLTSVLRLDPRFQVVFEDRQAVLFVPRKSSPGSFH